jgi:hypothetical protein
VYDNYGLGFSVNSKGSLWHIGSLPGTAANMGTNKEQLSFCILMNGVVEAERVNGKFKKALDKLPWQLISSI